MGGSCVYDEKKILIIDRQGPGQAEGWKTPQGRDAEGGVWQRHAPRPCRRRSRRRSPWAQREGPGQESEPKKDKKRGENCPLGKEAGRLVGWAQGKAAKVSGSSCAGGLEVTGWAWGAWPTRAGGTDHVLMSPGDPARQTLWQETRGCR